MTSTEVRRRASAGLFYVATSGVLNLVIAFFGSLVLARLLSPADFGVVAIGSTVVILAATVAEGGLGSGLIRRAYDPTRAELKTLLGLQLAVTSVLALVLGSIASGFGSTGAVVAFMTLTLPISAMQTPSRVVLTRSMLYSRIAVADLSGLAASYAWSIPAVLLGAGVWGMASGTVFRALVTSSMLGVLAPRAVLFPTLRGTRAFGPVARFGITFQAGWLVNVVRDQVINLALAFLAGVDALGQWSLARRMLDGPIVLFDAIHRVTFPAMSHALALDIDPRRQVIRIARLASIASSVVLAPLAASGEAIITVLFGDKWSDAADPFSLACTALMIGGPISAATFGYLGALGKPGVVLRSITYGSIAGVVVTIPLLPWAGAAAIGFGWLAINIVEAFVLAHAISTMLGVNIVRPVIAPDFVSISLAAAAWATIRIADPPQIVALALGVGCLLSVLAALLLVCRQDLFAVIRTVRQSLRDATSRRREAELGDRAARGATS